MAHTVQDAMILCGVNNTDRYEDRTPAQRIAEDVFNNDFLTCMDKSFIDLESDFKTYSSLTLAQGQLRFSPGIKNRVKAFVQWTRNLIRMGMNPDEEVFPVNQTASLIRMYKTHEKFIKDSSTLSDAAKPRDFDSDVDWSDWAPSFVNYLRLIPGRDGVPLSYVIRANITGTYDPNVNFMINYINLAPLHGEAYSIDSSTVRTLLINFITGNPTAEAKVQHLATHNDGRRDYITLRDHYEGVGVHAKDITKAINIIDNLYYSGEKKPHMWWDEFEKELEWAFNIYNLREGRTIHSNDMKLRILLKKVKADFLSATRASLNIELSKTPMDLKYEDALASFRNAVNLVHPPEIKPIQRNRVRRNVREVGFRSTTKKGRDNIRNVDRNDFIKRKRTDSRIITLKDGKKIEYHASFNFPNKIYQQMKDIDKERLKQERKTYKESRKLRTRISELESQISNTSNKVMNSPQINEISTTKTGNTSHVSEISRSTMMGGKNERHYQNHHNP